MPAMQDPRNVRRPWLAAFAALNAIAAWAGAAALVTGGIDFGDRANARLPFDSLVLAGLALAAIVAAPLSALAWSAWGGAVRTGDVALVVGLMLIGWIVAQVVVLRAFSLFQPAYLGIGAFFVFASKRVRLGPGRRGLLLVTVGAIVAAAGVGLLPHLVKQGLTSLSVASIVLLTAGITSVVAGAHSVVRGRRLLCKLAGSAATVIVLVVAISIIAPAVAATRVPSTELQSTPALLGLESQSLRLTTADGVELAAWYLQGTNRVGVVVTHGAGSTRSDVIDQAASLADRGYAVLLIDARGHGDSQGTAMDFGWLGDLDIAAGTAFLASRAEIDPERIGVVGFSMGGEEAIGAAASDPLISAVVAEGVTARRAADKEWLSDVYGWRGWLQERLEYAQDTVTDYLTEASPPIALRSAVVNAPDTRFLLITAGSVQDEGHAASFIRSGATERVTVWNVDGATHTDGYDTRPSEWQRHVVEFLDEHLR